MTEGRWTRVSLTREGTLEVADALGRTRQPVHLSLGTCQQLYLALRIALLTCADNVGRAIPILADDILVNFDEQRRLGAAALWWNYRSSARSFSSPATKAWPEP